jgi:hypothetical protein
MSVCVNCGSEHKDEHWAARAEVVRCARAVVGASERYCLALDEGKGAVGPDLTLRGRVLLEQTAARCRLNHILADLDLLDALDDLDELGTDDDDQG